MFLFARSVLFAAFIYFEITKFLLPTIRGESTKQTRNGNNKLKNCFDDVSTYQVENKKKKVITFGTAYVITVQKSIPTAGEILKFNFSCIFCFWFLVMT